MGAVISRDIPDIPNDPTQSKVDQSPLNSNEDNVINDASNGNLQEIEYAEIRNNQSFTEDNDAPEETPYVKESAPFNNQQYDVHTNGEYYDNNTQYYYDENGNAIYYDQNYYTADPNAYGTTDQVMEGYEVPNNQDAWYGENQNNYGVLEGEYHDPTNDNLGTEEQIENTDHTGGEALENQDYDNNEDYNEDYADDENEGEIDKDYDEAYNEGYEEGYKVGYQEGYEQTYNWYQAEYEKFNSENKYHLTYDRLPKDTKKFWKQRYSLFKKFDQGVFMTSELWYSVTPEDVALFVAKFIKACNPDLKTIADVCCGGGGNSIQFARKFEKVIALDINDDNLYCTKKNCEIYGVGDKVECVQADWIKMIDTEYYQYLKDEVDLVFCSPPWGGPAYKGKDFFDLDLLLPLPIKELLISFKEISSNIVLFLPRNSNLERLSEVTREVFGEEAKCRVLYTYCGGFIKGITAFWGDKFMPENYYTHPDYNATNLTANDQSAEFNNLNNNSQFKEAEQFQTKKDTTNEYKARSNRQTTPKVPEKKDEVMELDY
ncbi:hypothetical protein BN7_36 [Wickerhamomyces ciferrii]|uniref:Trimethylguanosine synthase n=1 Tax=Wickerhamomyces ciferrii (strain ATCC 14091 / BCRC 22168 / CBS 111 / JCM 3599 / NBRC 0793 / NRRL Y-1031 F-60-10) TaxID=1206466 RepID=K0KH49_WICCF|nr:uncharacterized protein BN7_36 [Wickerhamomyces ciferrii]CCH40503.1 hypothetical protein BN7_36 [Wickerhamomyces ciferrii]